MWGCRPIPRRARTAHLEWPAYPSLKEKHLSLILRAFGRVQGQIQQIYTWRTHHCYCCPSKNRALKYLNCKESSSQVRVAGLETRWRDCPKCEETNKNTESFSCWHLNNAFRAQRWGHSRVQSKLWIHGRRDSKRWLLNWRGHRCLGEDQGS